MRKARLGGGVAVGRRGFLKLLAAAAALVPGTAALVDAADRVHPRPEKSAPEPKPTEGTLRWYLLEGWEGYHLRGTTWVGGEAYGLERILSFVEVRQARDPEALVASNVSLIRTTLQAHLLEKVGYREILVDDPVWCVERLRL